MKYILDNRKIKLGVCYYPEQWPKEIWGSDLERMLDAGISVVRIAEFAWSKVEPSEGDYTFAFFDEFLDLCDEKGMKVIFSTPTAAPPAWLTNKYPEVLNQDINGVKFRHGSRRNYNYNSTVYLDKCANITEKVASHYGKRNCIIGWQLDNELNCEVSEFYSDSDTSGFRWWLLNKYHDLDKLNAAWGTAFWNQTYTQWDEIFVPRRTCNGAQNPHHMLDYFRFISDSALKFAGDQAEIIRRYKKPDDFITTNGLFSHLDNHMLTKKSLDFITYDSYPNFNNTVGDPVDDNDLRDRWWSKNLSETRSVSNIFGIMEQQSGANGWNTRTGVPNPRPGQITLWTMQSIAHGADYISFFRWRTATAGTEMYWHGILDYSGRDNERLEEIKTISNIIQKLDTVAGKEYCAEVAVVKDYENVYDSEIDNWHGLLEKNSQDALFETLQRTHTPFNYEYFYGLEESPDLSKYKVVFYPHPVISSKKRAEVLKKYVQDGGILILGARAGLKDMNGRCVTEKLPGVFAEMSGTDIKEYSFIQPDFDNVLVETEDGIFRAELFAERMSEKTTASVLGRYATEYFKNDIAFTKNDYGKGRVYYYGSSFNKEAVEYILDETGVKAPLSEMIEVPDTVELAMRGDCLFVLNYKKEEAVLKLKKTMIDAVTRETLSGTVNLKGYGSLVLKEA